MQKKQSEVAASCYLFQKLQRSMKVTFFLLLAFFLQVSAKTYSQQVKVSLEYENVELSKVLKALERQTNLYFFFNDRDLDTRQKVSVSVKNEALEDVLRELFDGEYAWELVNNMIVLKHQENPEVQAPQEVKTFKLSGVVKDEKGEALPGVTILIKGTTLGTSTDIDGKYAMALPEGQHTLLFSMVGMETKEYSLSATKDIEVNIVMKNDVAEMDEVVVTGIFKKAKESYTGAVTSVSKEDLKVFKGQNLLQTLKNIDVSINVAANNLAGSNPNNLPQINIRGNSSLPMSVEEYNQSANNAVNTPLIILDGFEISLERLMDYNDEEIESINILKDAAATAIYGSRGSNGVIVVITKQPEVGKLRVNAEVGMDFEVPDLTSYDMLNAAEKLQLEWDLGLYKHESAASNDVWFKEAYAKRLREIAGGTDTDWLGKPLRTGVGSHYNLRLEGGSEEFRWSATAGYKDTRGAMKDSYRKAFNGSLTLMYKVKNFTFKNYASYGVTKSKESKYGNFSDYVKQQPYNAPYDENGKLIRMFDGFHKAYTGYQNPLYDATLNSFDKADYRTLANNFSIEWQPITGLILRGQVGLSATDNTADKFLPAEHSTFTDDEYYQSGEGFLRRGTYDYTTGRSNTYSGNITISYSKTFAEKHQMYVGVDYALEGKSSQTYSIAAEGFTEENVNFLATARQYAKDQGPTGGQSKSRRLGLTGNVNYIYDNRYYVDFSARVDGSSTFGSEKKYAPFWSAGIGWNLHNEHFMEGFFANVLRLKASYGQTGTQQGSNGANTLYKFLTDNYYMNWTGAELQGLGNPYLTWQKTDEFNFGVEFGLWNSRFKGEFNVYNKTTNNLLSNMDMPHSMGFSSYVDNVGEVKNKGWEASASVYVIRDAERDINWMINGQLTYNKNYVSKLSDAIKTQNEAYLQEDVDVSNLFYEGRPQNGIYVVRSLGIDPSNGREIFLDKNGNRTDIWKASDKVYVGQSDPRYRGIASTMFMWKGLTVNLSMGFHWGGKVYNQTIIDRVEVGRTTLMGQNVDARALYERWQKPGDVVAFKGYSEYTTRATSRFVMDDKVLELQSASLQWKWDTDWVKKSLHAASVTFGVNISDLWHWSTVKMERGINYPFARNVQASIKFLF